MKNKITPALLSGAVLVFAAASARCAPINVVVPTEGYAMPNVASEFIFGNVTPATGTLTINGSTVPVYHNGAFLAVVPVAEGDFAFNLELRDGGTVYTYARHVKVAAPGRPLPEGKTQAEENSLFPSSELMLREGDWFMAVGHSLAFATAAFSIEGVKKDIPMLETPAGSGLYAGAYQIQSGDSADNAEVKYHFEKNGDSAKYSAKGRFTILKDRYWVVESSTDALVPVRGSAGGGSFMFMPPGTRALADARNGAGYRLRLSRDEWGWADKTQLKVLPEGTLPPQAVLGDVSFRDKGGSVALTALLSKNVPFLAEENGNSIDVTFYYTTDHTNYIDYDPADTFVKNIRWKQLDAQTCRLTVTTDPAEKIRGYNAEYSAGVFNLEIRRRPKLAGTAEKPLSGLKIVLDPGHSPKYTLPYDGAIGPTGYFEFEANLAIAKAAERELSALGAEITFTRKGDENVPLVERPRIAWRARGDLFISLHNNALPDGANPLDGKRGYTIYFYQPHSLDFAAAMHRAYAKNSPFPDEGLTYGDYHVVRQTAMPAILVETAYMTLPEQDALLRDPAFLKKTADTLTDGVLSYIGASRPEPKKETPKKSAKKPAKNKPLRAPAPKKRAAASVKVTPKTPTATKPQKPALKKRPAFAKKPVVISQAEVKKTGT
ncbi:MAG: N-acetylmuramoyl-L-alanine amidase [Elusimicrobiales bacterium]|nr:N-acetylmuramoyl-L-alanine amidase [Elusimicrobiales bacterium]